MTSADQDRDEPDGRYAHATGDLRSFGRRRGRRLRARQAGLVETLLQELALPLGEPAPQPITGLFSGATEDVWLEIGFGGGEHLIWQAAHNPGIGLIGCEPFVDGVAKVLDAIDAQGLGNIRIHADDARDVIRWLPDASVGRVFILFPDPWPKKRHRKRRLVTRALIADIARIIRPGGELRMASDIGDYAAEMLFTAQSSGAFDWFATQPDDWRSRPADWPPTRYEQKAIREGRKSSYLRFVRRDCAQPKGMRSRK